MTPGDADVGIRVCVLDVNETLSDLTALVPRLDDVGLGAAHLEPWFAGVLRDGFALTLLGRRAVFRDVAAAGLRTRLAAAGAASGDDAVAHVLDGFAALPLHPDVAPGLRRMHERGLLLVPLTNGATAMSERMFADAGVLDLFAHRLSVEDVGPVEAAPRPLRPGAAHDRGGARAGSAGRRAPVGPRRRGRGRDAHGLGRPRRHRRVAGLLRAARLPGYRDGGPGRAAACCMIRRTSAAPGPGSSASPSTTPRWSASGRFWLSLCLVSTRWITSSMPTIARS